MHQRTLRNSIRLFPFALCLTLSPLLAAQQVGQAEDPARGVTRWDPLFAYRSSINLLAELGFDKAQPGPSGSQYGLSIIPFGAPLKLTPADPDALAHATLGSTLTFQVVNNVIVRGGLFNKSSTYADAYAGDLIEAKVIQVREGKIRTRHGRAQPRVKEIMVGNYIKLELESSPRDHPRFRGMAKNLAVWSVKGPFVVVVYPVEDILLTIACSTGGCDL